MLCDMYTGDDVYSYISLHTPSSGCSFSHLRSVRRTSAGDVYKSQVMYTRVCTYITGLHIAQFFCAVKYKTHGLAS